MRRKAKAAAAYKQILAIFRGARLSGKELTDGNARAVLDCPTRQMAARLRTRPETTAAILALALPIIASSQSPAPAWHDPSPHTIQFVTVDKDVKLEVLDWGGTGRPAAVASDTKMVEAGSKSQQSSPCNDSGEINKMRNQLSRVIRSRSKYRKPVNRSRGQNLARRQVLISRFIGTWPTFASGLNPIAFSIDTPAGPYTSPESARRS